MWLILVLVSAFGLAMIFGCGEKSPEEGLDKSAESTGQLVISDEDRERFEDSDLTEKQLADLVTIEKMMHKTLIRWANRDKGGMYDNEFEYIRDKFTFAEYLNQRRIMRAMADSIVGYYATGAEFFDDDSVLVDDVVVFKGPLGQVTEFVNKDMLHWHQGRWIRPTLGTADQQRAYEELIRQADSAAAVEEAEGF